MNIGGCILGFDQQPLLSAISGSGKGHIHGLHTINFQIILQNKM